MPEHDVLVIGAGPGGYVAAIRAAQLGLDVACVERERKLGGTCLRVGCIPSKALLESSHLYEHATELGNRGINARVQLDLNKMLGHKDRVVDTLTGGVDSLFRKNNVTRYQGTASFHDTNGRATVRIEGSEPVEVIAEHTIIATGSRSAGLRGVEPDGERIATSTEALSFPEVPEHLVVIGAGYIGLEMGTVWRRLGSQVTVLEYLDRILPGLDAEIAAEAHKVFAKQGLEFRLGSRVTGAKANRKGVTVQIEGAEKVRCDRLLLAVGRTPVSDGLNLDAIGVQCDQRGFIQVDEQYRTDCPGVYAIGDVIGGAMLAHKAEEEGIACVESIAGGHGHVNYQAIPAVVYTEPEIASVGFTEEQLKEQGREYRVGSFPFIANGRARAAGQTDGRVKVLADAETDRILGVHIFGAHAGEMIAEAAAAIEFGASSEDLARTSHAHPTLSEAVKEACLGVANRSIHI